MKKQDLKQLIKPLVKECIHEVLLEEGLLSNIVAEVAQGMQGNLMVEAPRPKRKARRTPIDDDQMQQKMQQSRNAMDARRKKLSDAVGSDAYNGVNIFEGTEPLSKGGAPGSAKQPPSVLGDDPGDPGVDIGSLVGDASRLWKAMK